MSDVEPGRKTKLSQFINDIGFITGPVVTSLSSPDDSLVISNPTGSIDVDINLAHSNTFTANQGINFESSDNSQVTAFQVLFNKNVNLVNTEYGFASIYGGITDNSSISGEIEDSVVQKSGFEIGVFRAGDSTVNWIDGYESIRGYTSYISYAGTIQGAKHDADIIGHDITIQHNVAFSNDGTHLHRIFGNKINIITFGSVSIDSFVTRKLYGDYIEVAVGTNADVDEAYGLYIKEVSGGDTNYAIYSEVTAVSHLEGNLEVPAIQYGSGESFSIIEGGTTVMNWEAGGDVGIGTGISAVPARLTVFKSGAEQFRVGNDISNYMKLTVDSNANAVFDLVAGSGSPTFSFSDPITNTRINPRVGTIATGTTFTPTGDVSDINYQANTQGAGNLTMNAPTGTPVNGQKLEIIIKSTNVQTFIWNAIYAGSTTTALPGASTGGGKTDKFFFQYNSTSTKWEIYNAQYSYN